MAKNKPVINQRTYRTREHVLEDLSVNFLERKVLENGHELEKPNKKDYGTDAVMHHYDPTSGALENGRVEIQLKATDQLESKLTHEGTIISVSVQIANLNYWVWGTVHPFILILYDGERNEAYWLDVKQYYDQTNIDLEAESVTLHIPVKNQLDNSAIEHFRQLSLKQMKDYWDKVSPRKESET